MLEQYAKEKEEEYHFLKEMILKKYQTNEIDYCFLERIIEQVYWTGHYVGHCRGERYKQSLVNDYKQLIKKMEEQLNVTEKY